MASANVVQFDPSSKRRDQVLLSKLDVPVDRVREKSQLMLGAFFRVFFESVDDLIFELADKAEDAEQQNAYFESMRSLRMQRNDIIQSIHQGVDRAFAYLVDLEGDTVDSNAEHDAQCLSSIHDEQIEEALALESFISKANASHKLQLGHLCRRFSKVLRKPLGLRALPLSPESLCALLSEQVQRADLCSNAKLLIYSELEQKLQDILPAFYTSLNQVLAEANVLPELELKALKDGLSDRKKSPSKSSAVKKQEFWAQDQVKSLDDRIATVIETLVQEDTRSDLIPTQTLLSLLTTAQHGVSHDSSMFGQKTTSVVASIMKSHGVTGRPNRTDAETIKLVGILFECLYREHRLALPVKMQINRLQLPLIKVAIIDKSLFKLLSHPARIFLNSLVKMGQALGCSDDSFSKDSPLFEQLVSNIDSVINEFDTEISLFKKLNSRLAQIQHLSLSNHSPSDAKLYDEDTHHAARSAVEALLALSQKGKTPGVLSLFIEKVWKKVLIKAHMQHGSESTQWRSCAETLDKLIWSAQNNHSSKHRAELIKAIPSIKESLHAGLQTISYNPYEVAALLNSLSKLHLAKVKLSPVGEPLDVGIENSQASGSGEGRSEKGESMTSRVTDPFLKAVHETSRGEGFSYRNDKGEMDYCCLAATIKQSDAYIFVNRTGQKVVQYTATQFAQALKDGTLTAQGQGMAFDSALERVVTGLRRPSSEDT